MQSGNDAEPIAHCGKNCGECPAYSSRLLNNVDSWAQATAFHRQTFGSIEVPDEFHCDGCRAAGGSHFDFCMSCRIRRQAQFPAHACNNDTPDLNGSAHGQPECCK